MNIRRSVQSRQMRKIERNFSQLGTSGVDEYLDAPLTRWSCRKNFYNLREVGQAVRDLAPLDINPFTAVSSFDEVVDKSDSFAPRVWHTPPAWDIELEQVLTTPTEYDKYVVIGEALCELLFGQPGEQLAEVVRLYPSHLGQDQQSAVS